MQSNANYSNGYTRLPIKIPETVSEIVSGHLFESDFKPYFKMILNDPLGYALSDRFRLAKDLAKQFLRFVNLR